MHRLTVIVLAKNEAAQIGDCLQSVRFADERLVVDSGSTDATITIAREHATRIIKTDWLGFSATKALGLKEATGDWILWLDADERVTPELAQEMAGLLSTTPIAGYYLARKTFFLGRWIKHCGWYPGYTLRLFQREAGQFSDDLVHESVRVTGPTAFLTHPLIHYTDPTLEQYFVKLNHYTTLAARQLYLSGRRFRLTDLLARPIFTFVKMYVFKRGFLDGMQGLILCTLSAAYVFTKYAKLWHVWRRVPDGTETHASD